MANQFKRLVIFAGNDCHLTVVFDKEGGINQFIADLSSKRRVCQSRANIFCNLADSYGVLELT